MSSSFASIFNRLRTKKILRTYLLLTLLCLFTAGCSADDIFGSESVPEPVGIGRDRNDLKRSPCACNEIQQDYSNWQKG